MRKFDRHLGTYTRYPAGAVAEWTRNVLGHYLHIAGRKAGTK